MGCINSPKKGKTMKIVSILLAILMLASPVSAQETKSILVKSAMFCNTEQELQTLLSQMSLNNGKHPENIPVGCGQFVPEQPVPMMATPLYWYETPMAKVFIASFVYLPNGWKQWGYINFVINEDYIPSRDL